MKVLCFILLSSLVCGLTFAEVCLQCSSGVNTLCATNPDELTATECANGTITGCYQKILGQFTLRGCNIDLPPADLANCTLENDCERCIGISNDFDETPVPCNRGMPFPIHRPMCHQCSDTINSTVCAGEIAGSPTVCELYVLGDPCFIRRTATTVSRGCLSNSNYCRANVTNCFTCEGVGCNFRNITAENVPESPEGEPGSANMQRSTIFMSLLGVFIITFLTNKSF